MGELDNYLNSLQFCDGQPSLPQTTFISVNCQCGAVYATRVSLFENTDGFQTPVSDAAVRESSATCPVCQRRLAEARSASMFAAGGLATRALNLGA